MKTWIPRGGGGSAGYPVCDGYHCCRCIDDGFRILGTGVVVDDTPYSFQPYLSPLMLNRGCVDVSVSPAQKDSLPTVRCTLVSDYYRVCNRAVSRNPQAGKLEITRNWLSNGNVITVSGNVSRPYTGQVNIYTSKDFFFHTFIQRLKEKGITSGVHTYADCPSSMTALQPFAPSEDPSDRYWNVP